MTSNPNLNIGSVDASVKTINANTYYLNGVTFTGGGGTPGGSATDIQYNNGSAFAGSNNLTWNNTTGTLAVNTISLAGPGSASLLSATGTTLTANLLINGAPPASGFTPLRTLTGDVTPYEYFYPSSETFIPPQVYGDGNCLFLTELSIGDLVTIPTPDAPAYGKTEPLFVTVASIQDDNTFTFTEDPNVPVFGMGFF